MYLHNAAMTNNLTHKTDSKVRGAYFHFVNTASPTVQNLVFFLQKIGWKPTRFVSRARCSDLNLEFHPSAMAQLEAKHLLNNLMGQHRLSLMPKTLNLNFRNYAAVIEGLSQEEYDKPWILKPALMNNGQGIEIAANAQAVADYFSSRSCMQGPYVMQEYLTAPHLLQGPKQGHKYSLRYFVVFSNTLGAHLFKEGYANIALHPYEKDNYFDLRGHLSNEHLAQGQANVIQRPVAELAVLQKFFTKIVDYCTILATAFKEEYPEAFVASHPLRFALLGVDFMVDADERLWLLEVNHGPCFATSKTHPLYEGLYTSFWIALVQTLFAGNGAPPPAFIPLLR